MNCTLVSCERSTGPPVSSRSNGMKYRVHSVFNPSSVESGEQGSLGQVPPYLAKVVVVVLMRTEMVAGPHSDLAQKAIPSYALASYVEYVVPSKSRSNPMPAPQSE